MDGNSNGLDVPGTAAHRLVLASVVYEMSSSVNGMAGRRSRAPSLASQRCSDGFDGKACTNTVNIGAGFE